MKDKNNPSSLGSALEKLRKMFSQYVQIPEKEWKAVKPYVQILKIKKAEYFIKEVQVFRQVIYIDLFKAGNFHRLHVQQYI